MNADDFTLRPLLESYPDARRAKAPLVPPMLLPYLALLFGSAFAGLAAAYNAVLLRRIRLACTSLLVGAAGWIAFFLLVTRGEKQIAFFVIAGRAVHFALGGLLFLIHRRHVSGSEFLGGRALPVVQSYLVAFVLYMMLPAKVVVFLLGVPNVG